MLIKCKKIHKVIGYNKKDYPECPLCRTINTLDDIAKDIQNKIDEVNKKTI